MDLLIDDINNFKKQDYIDIYNIINAYKKDKIDKLKVDKRIKESLLGEKLLIDGLKFFFNIDYSKCLFKENNTGKPYIENYNIFYNISHSNGKVICVFNNNEVGVDIERVREVNLNTINIFATKNEKKYILEKDIYKRLFKLYTIKESYIKMFGFDLSLINSFEFVCNNKLVYDYNNFFIKTFLYKKIYMISICIKKQL